MTWPSFSAGQVLTADDLTAMQWQLVTQGSDQVVNNSTTLAGTDLQVPVLSGGRYWIQLRTRISSGSTVDVRIGWSTPAGSSLIRHIWGPAEGASGGTAAWTETFMRVSTDGSAQTYGTSSAGVFAFQAEDLDFTAGADGNLVMQFAQGTADGSDTTLSQFSYLRWLRIG